MEDEVYICGWRQDSAGFTLWVKSNPKMTGQGASLEEAEAALANSISDNWGAMHPVFEFVPPLTKLDFDAEYSQPELVSICGDTRIEVDQPRQIPFETPEEFEIRMQWYDQFFESPCCRVCGNATAPRNNKPLTVTFVESGFDGGFLGFPRHGMIHVFSDSFRALLTEAELSRVEFRKCVRTQRSRKEFFELIGPSGPKFVAVKNREFNASRLLDIGLQILRFINSLPKRTSAHLPKYLPLEPNLMFIYVFP